MEVNKLYKLKRGNQDQTVGLLVKGGAADNLELVGISFEDTNITF